MLSFDEVVVCSRFGVLRKTPALERDEADLTVRERVSSIPVAYCVA